MNGCGSNMQNGTDDHDTVNSRAGLYGIVPQRSQPAGESEWRAGCPNINNNPQADDSTVHHSPVTEVWVREISVRQK